MNPASAPAAPRWRRWLTPVLVALLVAAAQLWLVGAAGTDIPAYDQWDVEGGRLYPHWRDGTLTAGSLLEAHNEHRIVWTHLLNLALFAANGDRWDPLVQQAAGALLHGAVAGLLVGLLGTVPGLRGWFPWAVGLAMVPLAAWHNALWGFQSQVYLVLLFALPALYWLTQERRWPAWIAGWIAATAAMLAMGAGLLIAPAWLAWCGWRGLERRWHLGRVGGGLALLLVAWWLYVPVSAHAELRAGSPPAFLTALGRLAGWPHVGQPLAAIVMVLPMLLVIQGRLAGWRRAVAGEDFLLAVGCWVLLLAGGLAWSRGGGAEFRAGVPSRYVDLVILLPVVNLACLRLLLDSVRARRRLSLTLAGCWLGFLLVGWLGISAEAWRRVVVPLAREREVPAQLMREFRRGADADVYAGQARLLVPHPDLAAVRRVLDDPRMQGALPPSLQPEAQRGPLTRAVRRLLLR